MKIVLILSLVIGLFANEFPQSDFEKVKHLKTYESSRSSWDTFSRICVDGVVYLFGVRTMSPWINPNTMKFQKCEER